MKSKKPTVAIVAPATPSWVKRYWGACAFAFFLYAMWALSRYNDFFPFDLDRFYNVMSWDGPLLPSLRVLGLYGFSMLLFVLWMAQALWLGWLVLQRAAADENQPLARAVLSLGIGLALISLGSTALGFAHVYTKTVLRTLYGLGAAGTIGFSVWHAPWRAFCREAAADLRASWRSAGLGAFKLLVSVLLILNLVLDFTPEIFYDSLFYHLAFPHLYLLEHKIVNLPYMNFSKFPQGMEMLFGWGLALQGDIVAKLLHGSMGVFSFLALLILCRRLQCLRAWPVASLILLTIPVVSICLWNTSVDMAVLFYSLLALYAILQCSERPAGQGLLWASLAGVFSGMSAGVKYIGASVVIASIVTLAWNRWRRHDLGVAACKELIFCAGLGSLWIAPWMTRNFLETGNPAYPLFHQILGGRYLWPEHMDNFMAAVRGYAPKDLWGWIRIPWALAVGEPKGFENTCWLGPSFWVSFPALAFIPRHQPHLSVVIPFTLVNFMAEVASTNQARYLLHSYAGLAILIALGWIALYDQGWRVIRALLVLPLLGAGLSNLYAAALVMHSGYAPQDVLLGRESRHAYVSRYHPGMNPNPMIPLYEFMKGMPADKPGRVVFVAEEKTYPCPWPYVYGNVYDRTPLLEWNRQTGGSEGLYAELQRRQIRYIAYNAREGQRLATYGIFYWTPEEKARFAAFWGQHVRPVYANDGLYLFEIVSAEQARRQPPYPCPFQSL